jgi:predicted ferric reductase
MESLHKIIIALYIYGTDLIINTANILRLSYYEINMLIFCVLWPVITCILIFVYIMLRARLNKIKPVS